MKIITNEALENIKEQAKQEGIKEGIEKGLKEKEESLLGAVCETLKKLGGETDKWNAGYHNAGLTFRDGIGCFNAVTTDGFDRDDRSGAMLPSDTDFIRIIEISREGNVSPSKTTKKQLTKEELVSYKKYGFVVILPKC